MKLIHLFTLLVPLVAWSCKSDSGSGGGAAGPEKEAMPEGSYVLAVKDGDPTWKTMEMSEGFSVRECALKMAVQGQELDGVMNIQGTKEVQVESLSKDKMKVLIGKDEESTKMTIAGNEVPQPPVVKPLVGVPVILSKVDGEWTAVREDGADPTDKEQEVLDDLVKKVEDEQSVTIYGTEPRKLGDTWIVKSDDLPFMDGTEDGEGRLELTFDRVGTHAGMECAFLSGKLTLSGTPEDMDQGMEGTLTLDGTVTIIRSLEHFQNLSLVLDGTMDAEMTLPVGKMTMSGPMKGRMETTIQ